MSNWVAPTGRAAEVYWLTFARAFLIRPAHHEIAALICLRGKEIQHSLQRPVGAGQFSDRVGQIMGSE